MRLEVSQLSAFIFYSSFVVYPELVEGAVGLRLKLEKQSRVWILRHR